MPNTTLPTSITPGVTATLVADSIAVHTEVNELSRATGLRDLTSLLINGWTVASTGGVRIERVRDIVTLYIRGLDGTAATNSRFLDLPAGFGSMGNSFQSPLHEDAAGEPFRVLGDVNGFTATPRDLGGYWRNISYRSQSAWPTSLPGVAA